jgi:poly(A) polymerase
VTASPAIDPARAPWLTADDTRAVLAALTAGGKPARLVGGCVRDALAGRPVTDIDIATPEPPPRVIELLTAAGLKAVPTGIKHGTVTAVVRGKPFEVTTLRRDVSTDGRHAVVAFTGDWTEDAARRDFTMNALSADPDGRVHDPFGGAADLAAGRVRFVGEPLARIHEDVLRILRFFRFHANYGKNAPDAAGLAACRELAPLLPQLSAERVAAELLKLLKAPDAASTVRLMADTGILAPILPELTDIERLRGLQDVEDPAARDPLLRLLALLPDDPGVAGAVAERLRLSNAERERLVAVAGPPTALWPVHGERDLRRALHRLGMPVVRDLGLLALARGQGALGDPALKAAWSWQPVALPVKGQDAIDLGVPAGPRIGELIGAVDRWWEDGDYRADRAACLAHLKSLVGKTAT